MSTWIDVSEHVPQEKVYVLAFNEIIGSYHLVKWSAARGWLDQDDNNVPLITHWYDTFLPLTMKKVGKIEKALEKYNIRRRIF